MISKVEISFFKPDGFCDTYFVDTEDRGAAAKMILNLYDKELGSLNYVSVNHVEREKVIGKTILELGGK